jgi:hypothetical protein
MPSIDVGHAAEWAPPVYPALGGRGAAGRPSIGPAEVRDAQTARGGPATAAARLGVGRRC